jgi:hypothetical protein
LPAGFDRHIPELPVPATAAGQLAELPAAPDDAAVPAGLDRHVPELQVSAAVAGQLAELSAAPNDAADLSGGLGWHAAELPLPGRDHRHSAALHPGAGRVAESADDAGLPAGLGGYAAELPLRARHHGDAAELRQGAHRTERPEHPGRWRADRAADDPAASAAAAGSASDPAVPGGHRGDLAELPTGTEVIVVPARKIRIPATN